MPSHIIHVQIPDIIWNISMHTSCAVLLERVWCTYRMFSIVSRSVIQFRHICKLFKCCVNTAKQTELHEQIWRQTNKSKWLQNKEGEWNMWMKERIIPIFFIWNIAQTPSLVNSYDLTWYHHIFSTVAHKHFTCKICFPFHFIRFKSFCVLCTFVYLCNFFRSLFLLELVFRWSFCHLHTKYK